MKFVPLLLILYLLIPSIASSQKIYGKIKNLSQRKLIVSRSNDFINTETDTITTAEDGSFEFKFNIKKPSFITLKGKNFALTDIYTYPNANIGINADSKDIYGTRIYSGDLAFINNYYAYINKVQILKNKSFGSRTYKLVESEFLNTVNGYLSTRDSLKARYFKNADQKNVIIKSFFTTDSIDMVYLRATALFSYLGNGKTSEGFYYKNILPLTLQNDNDNYLNSSRYRFFWSDVIDYKLAEIRKKLPKDEAETALPYYSNIPTLISTHLSGKVKQLTAKSYIENIISIYSTSTASDSIIDSALEKLYVLVDNSIYVEKSRWRAEGVRNFKNSIKRDAPFRDFIAIDSTGQLHSFSELKDKIVYLDLWASWCVPCIAEFQNIEPLLKELNSDRFIYVTVSIDENKDDWLKALKKYKPKGVHLWIEGGSKNSIMTYYKINAIPHYFLIKPGTKLASFSAPRPSEKERLIKLVNSNED